MVDVIKRDGGHQAFSEKKVRRSIEAAAKEAKVPRKRIREVVDEASREPLKLSIGPTPVETKTIREIILARLDTIEPSVSAAWRAFDTKKR
jgi:transcriptional regulator NrdR family protein